MKTTQSSRQLVQIRHSLSRLALISILGMELVLGGAMVAGVGQTTSGMTSPQGSGVKVSSINLGAFAR